MALIKVGIVPYQNVQPLVWAFTSDQGGELRGRVDITPSVPKELAGRLRNGEFQVAIVPIFEYFLEPDMYTIIPDVSIGANGPVKSVMLFSNVPLHEVRRVALDTASLTSVHLVRVLLAELGYRPEFFQDEGDALDTDEARVVIGDPALRESCHYVLKFDLGQLWKELTKLPFVFAAWLVHPSAAEMELNSLFLEAKRLGLKNLAKVAEEISPRFGFEPAFALDYFHHHLWYELGAREVAGVEKFAELCVRHGLISRMPALRFHTR